MTASGYARCPVAGREGLFAVPVEVPVEVPAQTSPGDWLEAAASRGLT